MQVPKLSKKWICARVICSCAPTTVFAVTKCNTLHACGRLFGLFWGTSSTQISHLTLTQSVSSFALESTKSITHGVRNRKVRIALTLRMNGLPFPLNTPLNRNLVSAKAPRNGSFFAKFGFATSSGPASMCYTCFWFAATVCEVCNP